MRVRRSLGVGHALKRSAKAPVRRAFRRLGYELVERSCDRQTLVTRLLTDLSIATVLDVGANQGQYAEHLRASGFAGRIVSFEPGKAAFKRLQAAASTDPRWEAHRLALGMERSESALHISANSVSSSLLEVGPRHVDAAPSSAAISQEIVRVARLDQELAGLVGPAMLKIDAQGFELPVLQGAEGIMAEVALVQAELSLVELYKGQASYLDVLSHLGSRGFRPCLLLPGFTDPASGEMLQVDVVARRAAKPT